MEFWTESITGGLKVSLKGDADNPRVIAVMRLPECAFGVTPNDVTEVNSGLREVRVTTGLDPAVFEQEINNMLNVDAGN